MTWSYDIYLSTNKDQVRLYVGDTDTDNQLYSDEEINALLTVNDDNIYETAAQLADSLAAKYSRAQSLRLDDFSIDYSERATHFSNLATRLRKSGKTAPGKIGRPFVSGVSKSDMDIQREDTDRVPNRLRIGQFDHPGTETVTVDEELDE